MTIPPVALIEAALDSAADTSRDPLVDLARIKILREFRVLGTARLAKTTRIPHAANGLERGYLLGLETARQMLLTMPRAVAAEVTL